MSYPGADQLRAHTQTHTYTQTQLTHTRAHLTLKQPTAQTHPTPTNANHPASAHVQTNTLARRGSGRWPAGGGRLRLAPSCSWQPVLPDSDDGVGTVPRTLQCSVAGFNLGS
jgi:hypothetical protein